MRLDGPPLEASPSLRIESHLDVWYAGRQVLHQVPVGSGVVVVQRDQDVPERLDVAVPREWNGITLDPGSGGLLGVFGHRAHLTVTLSTQSRSHQWQQRRGAFQIREAQRDGASIQVLGHGPLQAVRGRKRARPYAPGRPSPIAGEVLSILTMCGVEGWVDPRLSTTRRVPADFVQGADLWTSLTELLTAWPARAVMGDHGEVRLLPGLSRDLGAPDVIWRDGLGGTLLDAPTRSTREGAFNHFLVKVRPEGDDAEEFVVEDWVRTGPLAVGTFGWESQEIDTRAVTSRPQGELVAANAAASAGLRAETVRVESVPDWRVEVDDVAGVEHRGGPRRVGRVTGMELPLASDVRSARYDVGVVA